MISSQIQKIAILYIINKKKNISFKFINASSNTDGLPYEKCLIILVLWHGEGNIVLYDQL